MKLFKFLSLLFTILLLGACTTVNITEPYSNVETVDPSDCFGMDWNINEDFFLELYPNYYKHQNPIFKQGGDVNGLLNQYYTRDRIDFYGFDSELIYFFEEGSKEFVGGSVLVKYIWNEDKIPEGNYRSSYDKYMVYKEKLENMKKSIAISYAEQFGVAVQSIYNLYNIMGIVSKKAVRPGFAGGEYYWVTDNYVIWIVDRRDIEVAKQHVWYTIFIVKKDYFEPFFIMH